MIKPKKINLKNILFCHLLDDYSGSPKILVDVINSIKEKCHYNILTSKSVSGFLFNNFSNVSTFFYPRSKRDILNLFSYIYSQLYMFIYVLFNGYKYDVIYINTLLPFGAALAGKICQKKIVYHIHETYIRPKILFNLLSFVCKLTADEVIVVSNYLKNENKSLKNVTCIHNSQSYLVKIEDLAKDSLTFNVIMVCSLKDYKGIPQFIDLSNHFKLDTNIQFTLQLNASEEQISEYKTNFLTESSNVVFLEKNENLYHVYKNSHLLLNLTIPQLCIETFGLTIIEAKAFGSPAIVPPFGGPKELVVDGFDGFQVDPMDIDKLKDIISMLYENRELYSKLSHNAYNSSADFSFSSFKRKIVAVLGKYL